MKKSDFYFDLPERLIAQHPLEQRDASRLMVLDRKDGSVTHRHFHDMLEYVKPGDCIVFNNSRVIPARLMGHAVGHVTPIEVLLLTDKGDGLWECLTRPGRKTRAGVELTFGDGLLTATVEAVQPDGNRLIRFHYEGIFLEILDKLGTMPLPPYIKEKLDDPERYQTVYSKTPGSAAAPTAGLHFTKELLEALKDKGVKLAFVTLHVGLGTFRPVKEDDVADHHMHSEYYEVTPEQAEAINAARARGDLLQFAEHLIHDDRVGEGLGRVALRGLLFRRDLQLCERTLDGVFLADEAAQLVPFPRCRQSRSLHCQFFTDSGFTDAVI